MNDSFPCSTTNWSPSNIRNGNVSTMCAGEINNSALVFGLNSTSHKEIVSRSVKTNLLNVSMDASTAREFHTNATSPIAICTTGSTTSTAMGTTESASPTTMSTTDAGMTDSATHTDMGTIVASTTIATYSDDVLAVIEADVLKKVSISYSLLQSVAVIFPQIFDDSQLSNIYTSVSINKNL